MTHEALGIDIARSERVSALLQSERPAKLIRTFASARKRASLSADELLIFLAVGYLGVSTTSGMIVVRPIALAEVSQLLGIPKETVRRKTARLIHIKFLENTTKGIVIRQLNHWCELLEAIK